MNPFDIRNDRKDHCKVCRKQMQLSIDYKTGESVYVCWNCYSEDFGGYPAYDRNGNVIGVCKAWIDNRIPQKTF